MTVITDTTLINIEDVTPATMTVAMFKQEPHDFQTNNGLIFRSGYDDLDYLDFAMLTLPSEHDVTLVRHKGSPQTGTELCVRSSLDDAQASDLENVASVIHETCTFLKINASSLQWIHPSIEQQIAVTN
jgi:hypothetical protein